MTTQDLTDLKQLFEFAILTGDKPPLTKSDCEMVVAAVDRVLKKQQWVKWSTGDDKPTTGRYLTTVHRHCVYRLQICHTDDFSKNMVKAYVPCLLPDPPKEIV